MKKVLSVLLMLTTLFVMFSALSIPSTAASTSAYDHLSNSTYAKVYTLSNSGTTVPYTNTNLNTRGTVTYGKSNSAYIDNKTDELYLCDVGFNSKGVAWAKVSYSVGSKRAYAYIHLSAISKNNGSYTKTKSTGKFNCSYRQGYSASSSYYVARGDTVYLLSTNGNTYQILYPISGGKWRIAFCSKSNYDKYCKSSSSNNSTSDKYSQYGIKNGSNAYYALESINSKYLPQLTSSEKKGTLIFMFEGVGNDSSSSKRMNAMCVVLKNGKIVYLNRNCSTIPDYPFDPSRNEGTDMPTLKSGIYNFSTTNHKKSYAALNVNNAKVVRFKTKNSFYNGTSSGINVHRRSTDTIAPSNASWVNSAGCIIIGKSGTSSSSEYAKFIQTIGIVKSGVSATAKYSNSVSGKIIIDRTYASSYLSYVGYSSSAIKAIG